MGTNITKLKGGKGAPPPMDTAPEVMVSDPRSKTTGARPLQFKVSDDVYEAFGALAAKEFGFEQGAKKKLFLKMFAAYPK